MKMLILAGIVLLAGCAGFQTIDEMRAEASSGRIGCPAQEIGIADNKQLTWTATCKGKVFYCHTGDGTSCKEAMPTS